MEVEFFKSRERKLVVLRKISEEERVTDFDATVIYTEEYDAAYRDLGAISKRIQKNYREYMGDKRRLLVELDSLVTVRQFFYLIFSQWEEFCTVWHQFETRSVVYEKYNLAIPKSRRELRND